ncbi:MAG: RT0821/Lpp0805 family surface protein [Pseudomonadota bacterium]
MTCLIVSGLMLTLTACSGVSNQDAGVVTGGLVGGALGSLFGGGSGKILATAGGAVLGAYLGGRIGKNMDDTDRLKMQHALNDSRTNHTTTWRNPDTHAVYHVKPTRTYYRGNQPCRDYTTTAIIGGKKESIYGRACRMADGSWKVVK